MTKSFKHIWPVFVASLIFVYYFAIEFRFISPISIFSELTAFFFPIVAIYYLYHSPFGQTQFLPISTLIIIRFLITKLAPFTWVTGISFYMGSNLFLLFYYAIRTLQKEPIQRLDYTKLFLVGGFILLQIAYYTGLLYIDNTPIASPDFDKAFYLKIIRYINILSTFVSLALILVHLWHLGKWEKDQLDENEMNLINQIGEKEQD